MPDPALDYFSLLSFVAIATGTLWLGVSEWLKSRRERSR